MTSAATPVCACVPFTKASPSFASSAIGCRPRACTAPPSSPSPIIASAKWASGARSPDAPTLPCEGTRGWTRLFSIATMSSGRAGRTPLVPRTSTLARNSIIARTASSDRGSPTPDAWLRIRLSCNWRARSGGIRTCASFPKPVVTPYIVAPPAIAASTVRRDARTASSARGAMVTEAPCRATATTSSIESDRPSRVTGAGIREEAMPWRDQTPSQGGRASRARSSPLPIPDSPDPSARSSRK